MKTVRVTYTSKAQGLWIKDEKSFAKVKCVPGATAEVPEGIAKVILRQGYAIEADAPLSTALAKTDKMVRKD